MAIIDKRVEFGAAENFTSTGLFPNSVDTGPDFRKVGPGTPLWAQAIVLAIAGPSGTYLLELLTDSDPALGSPVVLGSIVVPATAPSGKMFPIAVPLEAQERYLGMRATLGGTSPDITIQASLSNELPRDWFAYTDGIPAMGA